MDKRWPVTVMFALYFDHEPDGGELAQVRRWAETSYENTVDDVPTIALAMYDDPRPMPPVDADAL